MALGAQACPRNPFALRFHRWSCLYPHLRFLEINSSLPFDRLPEDLPLPYFHQSSFYLSQNQN